MDSIPQHLKKLKPFIAMELLQKGDARRRQGKDVISFGVGEPDLSPPACVEEALIKAIRDGFIKYTPSEGLLELREAIAEHYHQKYNVAVDPDCIIVTEGSSPAMLLGFSVVLSPGDEVIFSNPHYACYPAFVEYLHGKLVYVKTREEDGFQYRPEAIRKQIGPKTKVIMINSPANPMGTLLSAETMKEISNMGPWIFSDEVYHGLVYEGKEHSMLEFTDHAFVFNGFSKAYAMTGYRLGYLIAPKQFIPTLKIMRQNFYISATAFVQKAGVAALKPKGQEDQVKMRQIFNERRKAMLKGLEKIGLTVKVAPTGAFYVFANAKKFTKETYRFSEEILEKCDVVVTPGFDFGSEGEGFLRFSYATSVERIEEGLKRIDQFLKGVY